MKNLSEIKVGENGEPVERKQFPLLKDTASRVSFYEIIKNKMSKYVLHFFS